MAISDFVEQGLNIAPPVDGDEAIQAAVTPEVKGTAERHQGLVELADTNAEDVPFGLAAVNAANLTTLQNRLQSEAVALRQAELQGVEATIMQSAMTPEAQVNALTDARRQVYSGTAPEDLAIAELSARAIEEGERLNQADIYMSQAVEEAEKYSVGNVLNELRQQVDQDFEPTIPYLENTFEFISSVLLSPRSGGTNVAGLLENVFGMKIGMLESLAPGNQVIEAQKIAMAMSPVERKAAIRRARGEIKKRAGLLTDNSQDAAVMLDAIESAFGSRVEAESARVMGTWGQWTDMILTVTGLKPLAALKKAGKGVGRGVASAPRSGPLSAADDVSETVARQFDEVTVDVGQAADARRLNPDDIALRSGDEIVTPRSLLLGDDLSRLTADYTRSAFPAGSILRGRTGMPAMSPGRLVDQFAPPSMSSRILGEALEDTTGTVASKLGVTRSQIADDAIAPLHSGQAIRKGASLILPRASNQLSDAGARIANAMHDAKLYQPSEIDKAKSQLGDALGKLSNDDYTLINKSEAFIDPDTGRIGMNYVIGAGEQRSFATASEAKEFVATRLPAQRLDELEILRYDTGTSSYRGYTGDPSERGEYLIRARYETKAATGASKENVLKNATVNLLTNNVDTSVSYIKRFSDGVSRLDIRQSNVKGIFEEVLAPLNSLKSAADKDAVWRALKDAERNPVDFTHGELTRKLGGSQPRIEAYHAVRRMYKAIYETRNGMYRDFLSGKGYLRHIHSDGVDSWTKVTRNTDEVVSVYWDEAGTIVSKQSLEDKGINLEILENFKPKRVTGEDGVILETPYIAVQRGKLDLQPLPSQVLHHKETYLGRHMQTRYVIERMDDAIINGKPAKVGVVLGVANNSADAQKFARGASDEAVQVRRAMETTESDAGFLAQELNQMHDMQMLTNTNKRLDFEQLDVTRQASLKSPEESLDQVRNTMSRQVVLNEWVEYNTKKWTETYGDLINERGFPWGGTITLKGSLGTDPKKIAELQQARKARERIQLTAGISDPQIGERMQQAMLGASEYLSRASIDASKRSGGRDLRALQAEALNFGARGLGAVSDVNLVSKAKYLAHFSYIIMNPLRQLVMQSSSALVYGGVQHGSKYMATGHAARDFAYLAAGMAYKDVDSGSFKTIAARYAKSAGVSQTEAEQFFKMFAEGGTLGSVSSHQFLEHGFRSSSSFANHAGSYASEALPGLGARGLRTTGSAFRATEQLASKYGFEAGEKANRIAAYLAVRNKHIVNGTLKDLDAEDLATEALQIAGNMGQFNKAGFQSGALGVPFQFMSHTTRMIQYMMPHTKYTTWVASETLSNAEKGRFMLWNAAMFGTGGLGLASLFTDLTQEQGIDMDPLVLDALEEGFAGLALESLLEGLTGTEANLNISGTLGPLSGITGDLKVAFADGDRAATPVGKMYKLLGDMATFAPAGYGDLIGPGGGVFKTAKGIVGNVDRIWMNPVFDTGEKLELQMRDLAKFLPAINNVLQARIMANTGEYVSQYGTSIANITLAESLSTGLLGIKSESITDVYKLNTDLRGRRTTLKEPSFGELGKSGKEFASFTAHALRELDNGVLNKEEAMDRILAAGAAIKQAYPNRNDYDIFRAHARKELVKQFGNKETLADELVKLMATDLELQEEMGWGGMLVRLNQLPKSPSRDAAIAKLEAIRDNESGSKLSFEAEL